MAREPWLARGNAPPRLGPKASGASCQAGWLAGLAGSRLGWLDLALVWLDLVGFRLGFGRIWFLAFIYWDFGWILA